MIAWPSAGFTIDPPLPATATTEAPRTRLTVA